MIQTLPLTDTPWFYSFFTWKQGFNMTLEEQLWELSKVRERQ